MYVLGKKSRSVMHRHNILRLLGLTDEPGPGHGDTLSEQQAARRRMRVQDENVEWNRKAAASAGMVAGMVAGLQDA